MDFIDEIKQFSNRVTELKDNLKTEEATKTSLVLPFFNLLGYDIFNPFEFVPEFTADVGTKKGEKVDYAIMNNGEPTIIIEVKSCDTELKPKHLNQLIRYFSVTKSKFGILTNGINYKFYSDLEEPNKMDDKPFLDINLLALKDDLIKELNRFKKDSFDLKDILDSASELKYTAMIKNVLSEQLKNPSDQFVKALLTKDIYSGVKTQNVIDKFRGIIKISFNEYISELINEKIKNALELDDSSDINIQKSKKEKTPEFTSEELEILDYVKSLISSEQPIIYKKTERYLSLQLGENVRKWICRVFIKQNQKTFVLHKFDGFEEECEYYFDEVYQLGQIEDLICKVAKLCENS